MPDIYKSIICRTLKEAFNSFDGVAPSLPLVEANSHRRCAAGVADDPLEGDKEIS